MLRLGVREVEMAAFHCVVMFLLCCEWAQKCSCRFKVCVVSGLSTQQVSTVELNLLVFNKVQCEALSLALCCSRDTHDFYFLL